LDETYALPTEEAVTIALRTQQIIAHETGVANVMDPLGGSYYVEWLTDSLEAEALEYIRRIDDMGGMLHAVEKGYPQREIARSSYEFEQKVNAGERVIVGLNAYRQGDGERIPILKIDEQVQRKQIENLRRVKGERSQSAVDAALSAIHRAATANENLVPPIIEAAKVYATQQEICDVLRRVFGTHTDLAEF
jgi:methylmalonyl-CoA mutase N-terminal domain/subunit